MPASGNRLTLVAEIHPRVDPTTADPHDIGNDIIATFNEWAEANGVDPIEFVAAEWGHRLEAP